MKFLTNIVVVFLCTVFTSFYNSYSQEGPPISTAEKFNERGYSSSASSILDGNEVIGEYDGNLSLVYSTNYGLPNNIGFDLTTTFNANVSHKTFRQADGRYSGYSINKPAWIIGIKGFAIQTTNFEVNYYMSNANRMLNGEEIPLLIPGYHYTNRSVPNEALLGEGLVNDYIEILRDDGSVLSLNNPETYSNIGRYIESNSDGYGYAVVEWRPDNPYLRRMWYKPGDGLTYYFEEEAVKYNGRDSMAYVFNLPKIMYLNSITSNTGDTLVIQYSDWNENNWQAYNPAGFGRKLCRAIYSNRRTGTSNPQAELFQLAFISYNMLELYGESYLAFIELFHQYHGTTTRLYFQQNTGSPIFDTYMAGDETSTKIKYISHIVDELGRFNQIFYGTKFRKYENSSMFSFQTAAYLPIIIDYYNGKRTKIFYKIPSSTVDHHDFAFVGLSGCSAVNYSNISTLNATYRDDYSNFMVNERQLYNTYLSSNLVQKEVYNYVWGTGSGNSYSMCPMQVENIKTEISRTDYMGGNSSPSTITITKNFTKYRADYKPYISDDYGAGVIRLMSETIQEGNKTKQIINTWVKTGVENPMFWLLAKEEKITDGTTSSRETSYDYESISAVGYGKRIKTKVVITDPRNLNKETGYTSFLPTDYDDEMGYYYIELKNYEKVYSGSITKTHDAYTYYDSGEKIGKLNLIIKNVHSKSSSVTNDYYTMSEDSVYYGFLKSQTLSNGITKKFYYPRFVPYIWGVVKYYVIKDTAYGYYVTNDDVRTYKSFITENYQTKPFRTEVIYNNDSDTLRTWTRYDTMGNLQFETDVNGNYSEYNYDAVGRMLRAKLPGSFYTDGQMQNDTTYILQNTSSYASRQFSIRYDGVLFQSFRYTRYETAGPPPLGYSSIVEDSGIEGDDPIGGGGGGSTIQNYDFFVFFPEPFNVDNIYSLNQALFAIKTTFYTVSEGQNLNFTLSGVTQVYSGSQYYETVGQKIVTFQEETLMSIDVSGIVQSCINAGKDLYGFKLSAAFNASGEEHKEFRFDYDIIPTFNAYYQIINLDESNARSSVKFSYDDANNKVEIIKRFNHDPQDDSKVFSRLEYDSFGQLRNTLIQNAAGTFITKKETNYNYLGLKADESDGENRDSYVRYDYLSRPVEVRYDPNYGSGERMTTDYLIYNGSEFYDYTKVTDEDGKVAESYLDEVGNLKSVKKYDNGITFETKFNYKEIYQLVSVETPGGKTTSYVYDTHGNIKERTTPDEGTTKYKYDKYGNLRFSLNAGAGPTENALAFNKYDDFGRLIISGLLISTYGFDELNPDFDYSVINPPQQNMGSFENFNTDTANFVIVNMYDKFEETGVFDNISTGFGPILLNINNIFNLKGKLVATAFRDKLADEWSYKLYGYDELGRCKRMWIHFNSGSQYKQIFNEYDNFGNLTKQKVDAQFYYWYDYDEQGRLQYVWSSIHNAKTTAKLEVEYSYDNSDLVTLQKTNPSVDHYLHSTFSYDDKGRTTSISGKNWLAYTSSPWQTVFQEDITYFPNSNISNIVITNKGDGTWQPLNFTYEYDGLNRLTNSIYSQNSNFSENYYYDKDGNFTFKFRNSNVIHYFYDEPGTNKLSRITTGGQSKTFNYDYRGNMIYDGLKDITISDYERRNLPLQMTLGTDNYFYNYDDKGNRINKKAGTTNEYYFRDHTGRELLVFDNNTGRLKMANIFGNGLIGRVDVDWEQEMIWDPEIGDSILAWARYDNRFYYLKDHLGSIRVTLDENADVVGAQDYYPFGEVIQGRSFITGGLNEKYKFTEKERDTETNYDYFGARFYDSELGRWLSVDPLADMYPGWSPYNYTLNNPLRFVDPDGNGPWGFIFKTIRRVILKPILGELLDEVFEKYDNNDLLGERPIGKRGEDVDYDGIDDYSDGIDDRLDPIKDEWNKTRLENNKKFQETIKKNIMSEQEIFNMFWSQDSQKMSGSQEQKAEPKEKPKLDYDDFRKETKEYELKKDREN